MPGAAVPPYHPAMLLALLDLRVRHGLLFQSQDRAGDLRLVGVSLHRRQLPIPTTIPSRPSASALPRRSKRCSCRCCRWRGKTRSPLRHGEPGRHQDPRQCQPPQRPVLRTRRRPGGAAQGRGPGTAGAGRGGRWRHCPRRHEPPGGTEAARRSPGGHRRGQGQDRGAGRRALGPRAGRLRGQARRAGGQSRRLRPKKPGGKAPQPPTPGPRPSDQVNLTDEESRIMPVAGGGFEQCYNAQALVDTETCWWWWRRSCRRPTTSSRSSPMLERLAQLPEDLRAPQRLLADTGYFSAANVVACETRRHRAADRAGAR